MRQTLYEWIRQHKLNATQAQRLTELAGLSQVPAIAPKQVALGLGVVAAGLGGFGVILWLAANWESLGRFGRFGLLECAVLSMGLGALWRPAWRPALGLMAFLCTGGLFAYFGQTYQTGADPWQLFAVWAALTLPLCWGTRSDVTWTPWALVVMTALSLWVHAHSDHDWRVSRTDIDVHVLAWAMALVLCGALSPRLRPWTGTGPWAFRLGLTLAALTMTLTALGGLFSHDAKVLYAAGLVMLGTAAILLTQARFFDVFALSVTALGLNVLLVFGLGDLLFSGSVRAPLGAMLLLGLCAAGLLTGTVSVILHCHRRQAQRMGDAA